MDDNDDARQSADDALEPQDDIFNSDVDEETLPEDGSSPAAPATDVPGSVVPIDDPRTDSGLDEDELYNEGLSEAVGADDNEIDEDNELKPLDPEDDDE